MPAKKANKGTAKRGAAKAAKPQNPSGQRGAHNKNKIAYAATNGNKSKYELSSVRENGNTIARIHLCDAMGELFGPARQNGIKSDAIPFTLANNSNYLYKTGDLFPKLQGFAKLFSRYRIKKAVLHWTSLCSADTKGSLGLALVPGIQEAVIAVAELASFSHAQIGALWGEFSTPAYHNLENRWYFTDGVVQGNESSDNIPFTVLRLMQNESNTAVGVVWLEIIVDFVDMRPAAQSSVDLQVGVPVDGLQTFTGGASRASQLVQYGLNQGMDGLFEWGSDFVSAFYEASSPSSAVIAPPGSGVGVDGGDTWNVWFDAIVSAVTAVERKQNVLSEWPLAGWEELKTPSAGTDVYPKPWSQPIRKRTICKFKSVREAREARLAGFNPERLIQSSPNAAGDCSFLLLFQPAEPYQPFETLLAETFSPGTGAFSEIIQHRVQTDLGPGTFYWEILPTGTEARTLGLNSSLSLDKVRRVEF